MEIFKRILVIAVTTAALVYLASWSAAAFGVHGPLFAFLANWLVMAWGAIIGQVWELRLPAGYYRLRPFESDGGVYECLGIRWFKKLVRRGPLTVFAPTLRLKLKINDLSSAELVILQQEMCKTEAGHFLIGFLVILMAGYALLQGWWDTFGWLLLFNILINAYPVMLQRYNRAKLQPLLEKANQGTA